MQSNSTGIWYFECPTNELESYLLSLQSRSIIYPDEYQYLASEQKQLFTNTDNQHQGVTPICYRGVTLIPKQNNIEIIINRHQEKIDHVTQLPLRVSLLRQVGIWYENSPTHITAMCIVELNDFSNINDTVGHAAGDVILYEISQRLGSYQDLTYKLARLHGDEFALAVTQLPSEDSIWTISQWITRQFELPFQTQKGAIYITPSIGMALKTTTDDNPVSLLENAYIALNHAKDDALVNEKLFTPAQEDALTRQVMLESQLNQALENTDELEVWYQPKQNLATGQINGLEALIRWQHPTDGLISPAEFIPLAERTGLICEITNYVIDKVAQHIPTLRELGFDGKISINISANDFLRLNLVNDLLGLLAKHQVATSDIELEITEGAFINDFNHCITRLKSLKQVGFALSIDDFGTGYSSLSYLTKLPVDTIKIDMSFVRQLAKSEQSRNIYQGLIHICKALYFKVLAEGVDDNEQRTILRDIGCDSIQGYLLSKPLAIEPLTIWFANNKLAE
jgi:diguanylate cyclase (GGDEF)-like protein